MIGGRLLASLCAAGETRPGRYAMSLATMLPAQMETPTLPQQF
jgi:hypothetical protein